jgi:hypothetical protein
MTDIYFYNCPRSIVNAARPARQSVVFGLDSGCLSYCPVESMNCPLLEILFFTTKYTKATQSTQGRSFETPERNPQNHTNHGTDNRNVINH